MTSERMGVDLDTLARQAASEVVPAKFVRARQLVDGNVAIEEKTLVWANFIHHIESLQVLMADYEPAVIMGSVPASPRRRVTGAASSPGSGRTLTAGCSWPRRSVWAKG